MKILFIFIIIYAPLVWGEEEKISDVQEYKDSEEAGLGKVERLNYVEENLNKLTKDINKNLELVKKYEEKLKEVDELKKNLDKVTEDFNKFKEENIESAKKIKKLEKITNLLLGVHPTIRIRLNREEAKLK